MRVKGGYKRVEEMQKGFAAKKEGFHIISEYNERGQIVRQWTDMRGVYPYKSEDLYIRDDAGKVLRIDVTETDAEGETKRYSLYEYDDQGKLKMVRNFTNGEMTGYRKYTHDEKDNADIVLFYKGDELKKKYYRLYDSEHRLIMERVESDPNGENFESMSIAIYDPDSELVVAGCQTNPNYMYRNELVKDENGNVVEMRSYSDCNASAPDHEVVFRYFTE